VTHRLERLPLVTLYLTERCNSRCVTCDYWRHGRVDATLESVKAFLPDLSELHTRVVLLSGGEPLLNPEWEAIARLLRERDLGLWLLTSGLSLAKHAARAAPLFDAITVSLDGTNPATYAAIRGLDAFDKVCEGISAAVSAGSHVGLRVTVQRANFRELPEFIELGHRLGVSSVSFLAVDVGNPHAFGRTDDFASDLALRPEDLTELEQLLTVLETRYADDFRNGFIAESPAKLRRLHQYFAALQGAAAFPKVRCNAPEFSAVVGVRGEVQPCFFISAPPVASARSDGTRLEADLNSDNMIALRESIRSGQRSECSRCVCYLHRDLATVEESLLPRGRPSAMQAFP
jgi:Fe-coproporphyrin III synthase